MDPEWSWMGVNENENENEKQKSFNTSLIQLFFWIRTQKIIWKCLLRSCCLLCILNVSWNLQVPTDRILRWRLFSWHSDVVQPVLTEVGNSKNIAFRIFAVVHLFDWKTPPRVVDPRADLLLGTWTNKRNGTDLKRTKHTGKKRLGNKNEDVSWPEEMSWQMDWRLRATIFCTGFFLHSSPSSPFHFSPLHSTPAWFIPLDSFFLLSSFFFFDLELWGTYLPTPDPPEKNLCQSIVWHHWFSNLSFLMSIFVVINKTFWRPKIFRLFRLSNFQTAKNFKTIHFLLCYYTFDYACIGEPMMAKFCLLLCYFSFDYACIGKPMMVK